MARIRTEEGVSLGLPRRKLLTVFFTLAAMLSLMAMVGLMRGGTFRNPGSYILDTIGRSELQSQGLLSAISSNGYEDGSEFIGNQVKEYNDFEEKQSTKRTGRPREQLGRRPRLLCWLMTDPKLVNKTIPARDTWMKRCDVMLFMSSRADPDFPTIGLEGVKEGRDNIAQKSRTAWTYIYNHHIDDADFFIKADPDTYIMVDNLRYYLSQRNTSEPHIFGHGLFLKYDGSEVHYAAGQAIVLTKESVRRLVSKALVQHPKCFKDGQFEDFKTGMCLAMVGGHLVDTRDNFGRETFLPPVRASNMRPEVMKTAPESAWIYSYRGPYGKICEDMTERCISERPVVFHRVTDDMMYMMDLFERLSRNSLTPDIYENSNVTSAPTGESTGDKFVDFLTPGDYFISPKLSFNGTEFVSKVVLKDE